MFETKSWAFTTEFGSERVTARRIKQLRLLVAGRPLGETYWSPHSAGKRKKVKHVIKLDTPFFAYIDSFSRTNSDGGESLSHLPYKETLSRLGSTELRLKNGGRHKIRIIHAQMEKSVTIDSNVFAVDAYCRFESDSALAKKWGGEVCFEVCHTHPVPADKIIALRKRRMPVVEVKIPQCFQYKNEEITTEELEQRHSNFLIEYLEDFIVGEILSNPSSIEFLEEQLVALKRDLNNATDGIAERDKSIDGLKQELAQLEKTRSASLNRVATLSGQLTDSQMTVNTIKQKITKLERDLQSKRESLESADETLAQRNSYLIVTSFLALVLFIMLLYLRFRN